MSTIYFPSCNFNAMRPETGEKLRAYLAARLPVAGCCRLDRTEYSPEDEGLYLCQACRETLAGRLRLVSLWEYLDADESFTPPDRSYLTATIQDCWRDREHPEIHAAVRSLLRKMGVRFYELEGESRERAAFCGDLHYEPRRRENIETVEDYARRGEPLAKAPPEVMARLMGEQVEKFSTEHILTYCNRCTRCLEAGGGKAIHIAELMFE